MKKLYVYYFGLPETVETAKIGSLCYSKACWEVEEKNKTYVYFDEYNKKSIFKKEDNDRFIDNYQQHFLKMSFLTYQTENDADVDVCAKFNKFAKEIYEKRIVFYKEKINDLKQRVDEVSTSRALVKKSNDFFPFSENGKKCYYKSKCYYK